MFTERLFQLSSFSDRIPMVVERECEFSYVGKIPTRLEPRLVACTNEGHILQAVGAVGVCGMIVPNALRSKVPKSFGLATSNAPLATLFAIQADLAAMPEGQWKSFTTCIHPQATIMPGAVVAPKDVIIDEGVIIHPNAVICPRTIIGKNSTIGPGTIVGTDAFEVDTTSEPRRVLPQSGGVRIGQNVDIQAKCTIVRATFGGFTEIGDETKFDCQIHFAHDCRAGKRVRIAACAEISGRVDIADDAFIAPNVSISNGCSIGKGAFVTIGSVVTRDVPDGARVTGIFAIEHVKWLEFMRSIR